MLLLFISALIVAGGSILFLLQNSARYRRELVYLRDQRAHATTIAGDCERRYELMFSANPHPMWVQDCENLRFLKVNDAAIKAYGYSREEFLAMTILDIRPEEDKSALLEAISQDPRGYSSSGTWRHRRKDGSLIFMEIMGFVVSKNGHGEKLVLALDVTERCRVECRRRLRWARPYSQPAPKLLPGK